MTQPQTGDRDRPWLFRTYAGHSSAQASNVLYKTNLARGQTGLSVAFDLPTQTGYDSDDPLARGEVGKVGVPITSIADMRLLFDGIPLDQMNTSMTINATAPWMLALYVTVAEEQGASPAALQGTVQNDLIKEYLSRGTYIFPPGPSLRLISDVVSYSTHHMSKWNPTNVCSYHLQEAGATPVQELAYALATAIAVLDTVKARGEVTGEDFERTVGRISFFVNAGIRFVTEMCKMRAFVEMWDEITQQRYGVSDPKYRRFRYGVQVNSLGLTEQQPENNVYRILLEALAVTLSKDARCRALQLPAWNEALGLPRPWDQQWSLRLQQILAHETDLLEFGDLFEGNPEVARKVAALKEEAYAELKKIDSLGGAVAAVESGYMKSRLVESGAARLAAINDGSMKVVGVNCYEESASSPLSGADSGLIEVVDHRAEREQIERLQAFRASRDQRKVTLALDALQQAAREEANVMPSLLTAAKAGVTTGEWGQALREVFGQYQAPTGIAIASTDSIDRDAFNHVREQVEKLSLQLGRRIKILIGKPGLDGHSNGAEQIAVAARDCGMEVVYEGIRLSPERIANAALDESVHLVGLSVLSGSHNVLVEDVIAQMASMGIGDIPLIVGGIIPPEDERALLSKGVARVYTPKDFQLSNIMVDMVAVIAETTKRAA